MLLALSSDDRVRDRGHDRASDRAAERHGLAESPTHEHADHGSTRGPTDAAQRKFSVC